MPTSDGVPPLPLHVDSVSVRYGAFQALNSVSLSVGPGEVYVLLGPNGAGKSTLMSAIAGHQAVTEGAIRIAGFDTRGDARARRHLGMVPQRIALFDHLTAEENLHLFGAVYGLSRRAARERAQDLLTRLGLQDKSDARAARLSGGMRRRVHIAAALLHEPALLLLDEPTAGLDEQSKKDFRGLISLLRGRGLAIFMTTHELGEASAVADRMGVLVGGALRVETSAAELNQSDFGRQRVVSLTCPARPDPAQEAFFRSIGLHDTQDGRAWRGLIDGEGALRELMGWLGSRGIVPGSLSVARPDLKDLVERVTHTEGAA